MPAPTSSCAHLGVNLQDWKRHSAVCKPRANVKRSDTAADSQQDIPSDKNDAEGSTSAVVIRSQEGSTDAADETPGRNYLLELPGLGGMTMRLSASSATPAQMRKFEDIYEEFVATCDQELLDE